MVPIVYSPKYNITAFGLERFHPFDSLKYHRIYRWLLRQGLRKPHDFISPAPLTAAQLLLVHSPAYLQSLKRSRILAGILELPFLGRLPAWLIYWRVLRPMLCAVSGTVHACRLALEQGLAVNLGGGFHHAGPARGGGFCVYADGPLALTMLQAEGRTFSALVVDTDAHQGDGTADALRPWPWAHVLDFYEDDLFPWAKVEEDMAVPLPPRTNGAEYMSLLRERLPQALDRFHPDFVLYNAGSDVLWSDPLSRLMLTADDMAERDLYVVTEVRDRGISLAMVLSGGYGPASWEAHARSLEDILARFDRRRIPV